MKRITLLLVSLYALLALPACSTTNGTGSVVADATTTALLTLAGSAIAPVLAHNPDYIPVAQAVDGALSSLQVGLIDAQTLVTWVNTLGAERGWTPAQTVFASTITSSAWAIYVANTGHTTANISDPKVGQWITAFRAGLSASLASVAAKR